MNQPDLKVSFVGKSNFFPGIKTYCRLCHTNIIRAFVMLLLLAIANNGLAQVNLPGNLNLGPSTTIRDYIIPGNIKQLKLEIAGGRGESEVFLGFTCYRYFGGRGALISAGFYVGDYTCPTNNFVLKPGGTLRFIVGVRGDKNLVAVITNIQGAGGGGSAVLYKAPGTSNWVILMVAGGGGGAGGFHNNGCGGNNGKDAELGPNGSIGAGLNPGAGGTNGNGGAAGGLIAGDAGGGGGAFSNGANGTRPGIGGRSESTTGGAGGEFSESQKISFGGFGFGGGGASASAGGGGGGYSGGGGGGVAVRNPGGGGGGGSFIIQGAVDVSRTHYGTPGEISVVWNAVAKASFLSGSPALEVRRIFVNEEAPGNSQKNGTSWANAFTELQDAFTAAANTCQAEIWVARGTYQPDRGIGYTKNNRNHSFVMRSGVAIYGGFNGTETALNQRNHEVNKTFLSGDLAENNFNFSYSSAQFSNFGDNSLHVVRSENTSSTAILDGFFVESGNANGSFPDNSGGGIYSVSSGTQIQNCTVRFNQAVQGGGLYNAQSSPFIQNCFFLSNNVTLGAAGAYILTNSNPFFYNCVFQGNYVGTSSPDGGGGGAILNFQNSAPEFINCTVSGNFANTGGAVYNLNNARPIFYNSIIWQNKSVSEALRISSDVTSEVQYRNCLVQGLNLAGANGNLDGTNQNAAVFITNDDPNLAPASIGVLALRACSPAIDRGNNGFLANPTDIAGNPRFINTTVDLGAYEAGLVFVNAGATGGNNGINWANAFRSLQDALAFAGNCPIDIWVARGTYTPTATTNRDIAFTMKNIVGIYGGFAGTETALNQRNWQLNPTILSGDIGVAGNRSDNSHNIISNNNVNASAILDGFIILNGQANKIEYGRQRGAGMFNFNASPLVRNCIFTGNMASTNGGAVFNQGASATPTFVNCVFSGNQALFGGGIFNERAQTQVINCTFSANQITGNGGGIYSYGIPKVVVRNSIFWGNAINGVFTAAIDNSTPVEVTNSIVQGGYSGTGNSSQNPLFVAPAVAGLEQLGDLRLLPCSPAINVGNNSALPNGTTTDLAGLPRIGLTTVDMGAYELQINMPPQIIFVNTNATGSRTGLSWENAMTTLQGALALNCLGNSQIWVTRGTYRPAEGANRDSAFVMRNNQGIFGGFTGNEIQLTQRNWRINPTILSGDIGVAGNRSDNSHNVISNNNNGLNATSILDGFIVRDGQANKNETARRRGGGMYNLNASPLVRNCIFTGNFSNFYGGAVFNQGASATPTFVNCVFSGNQAEFGGGIFNESAQTQVINCTFSANQITGNGGGIYSYGTPRVVVRNSIFWGNAINGVFTAAIDNSTPIDVTHSTVQGGYTGTANLLTDPRFNAQVPIGLGQLGDFRLLFCSPARNSGRNAAFPADLSTDLDGLPRVVGVIDRGAFERVAQNAFLNIYVDSSAEGANNGTGWENAFVSLQSALNHMNLCANNVSNTIHIAAGTYPFPAGVQAVVDNFNGQILGGYPAGGGDRDATNNQVIIRGNFQVIRDALIDGVRVISP